MSYDQYDVWDAYFKHNPDKVIDESPNGVVIEGRDHYGTPIRRESYGHENSDYGWNLDHIQRSRHGGKKNVENLRPMHISNNQQRN